MKSLVSLLSPTYNGAAYIRAFLDSVCEQSYPNIELIIVDDGSTDTTAKIIEEYRAKFESRNFSLVYAYQENRGQAAAINFAFEKMSAQAEYFMWVDSDDILFKDNVSHKVKFLEQHSEYDFCLCNVVSTEYESKILTWKKAFSQGSLFENFLFANNIIAGFGQGTVLVRKALLEKAIPSGKIYESRQGQNWQLMLPFTYCGKAGHLDEVLFKYVIHNDSHSHTKRNFAEQIKRFDEFEILISETLRNIPTMPDSERDYYIGKIHEKYLKEKLNFSYAMRHFDFIKTVKAEMQKENFSVPLYLSNYVFYSVYKVISRIFHIPFGLLCRIKAKLRGAK